jgi:sulfatase modifying factor 1
MTQMIRFVAMVLPLCVSFVGAQERSVPIDLDGGMKLEMLRVEAGEFMMSSPESEAGRNADETQRRVRITKPYLMGKHPVTRAQFERFIAETHYKTEAEDGKSGGYGWNGSQLVQAPQYTWRNPGFAQDGSHPVTIVTWFDAMEFCKWLSRKSRLKIDLPTEAQWEYACRAGDAAPWPGGDASKVAWHKVIAGGATHPSGTLKPNAWGFTDMGGNVWEWCADWYGPYPGVLVDPLVATPPAGDKARRVLRGGSFLKNAAGCRSAARYRNDPRSRNADNGFRIMTLNVEGPPKVMPVPVESPAAQQAKQQTKPQVHQPAEAQPMKQVQQTPTNRPTKPESRPYPPAARSSSTWKDLLSGLPCVLVPMVIGLAVYALVRFVKSTTRSSGAQRMPEPQPAPGDALVARMDNGFWMKCEVPPGTNVNWTCMAGGKRLRGTVSYQPGPNGQFIVTGAQPSMISVVMAGAAASLLDSALSSGFGIGNDHDDDDEDARRRRREREEKEERQQRERSRSMTSRRDPSAY